jgi:hypothetical protein
MLIEHLLHTKHQLKELLHKTLTHRPAGGMDRWNSTSHMLEKGLENMLEKGLLVYSWKAKIDFPEVAGPTSSTGRRHASWVNNCPHTFHQRPSTAFCEVSRGVTVPSLRDKEMEQSMSGSSLAVQRKDGGPKPHCQAPTLVLLLP